MSFFGYRRELSKYEDVDEDELLASLSPEELAELEKELADIDPDANVPIGLRQRDQTDKSPTGTFSRDSLMKYWENETRRLLEDEICGGSSKADKEEEDEEGVTEGNSSGEDEKDVENEKEKEQTDEDEEEDEEEEGEESEEEEEAVTEEEEEEDEEEEEEERDNKLKPGPSKDPGESTPRADAPTLLKPQKVEPMRLTPPPPPVDPNATGNPTVVDDALQRVLSDDPKLTEVNLNNIDDVSQDTLIRFAEALTSNAHVRVFSLANTRADDPVALAIAKMLRENSSIVSLNIESNYVTGKGVMALVQALPGNNTLTELRFHNQRHMCGGQVEMEMVKLLRENYTLIKLGYQFNLPGPRMSMTGILTRNQDRQRQKRLQEQRQQQQGAPQGAVNPRTTALKRTPHSSPCSSPRASPWSSPKIPKKQTPPAPPPPPPPPPPLPPPPPPPPRREKKPTRVIAEVIKKHEVGSKKAAKTKGKKAKKEKLKASGKDETTTILRELKNALRPVSMERRVEEGSRPSTPMRSAHDQLMESIRSSSVSGLKQVELPHYLQ
ncbi:leiomodin-2 [Brachionichthys hirsutus]|uniref:leiomodin-2 n=1 Tax=Brachionichthys hirsutus TaxID=412623 RepID=UPI0036050611